MFMIMLFCHVRQLCCVCWPDILAELNEWGPVFTLWSNSEDRLSGALSGVAKAIEKCYVALQELVNMLVLVFW